MKHSTFACWSALTVSVLSFSPVIAAPAAVVINGHEASPDRVIVKWKDGVTPRASLAEALGANKSKNDGLKSLAASMEIERSFDKLPGIAVLHLPHSLANRTQSAAAGTAALKQGIEALETSGLFEYVQPDYVVHASRMPTDAAFTDGRLWGLRNTGQNGGVAGMDIAATTAWDVTTGSNNVIVGVIDTGVRYTHQDLRDNMWHNPGEIAGNGIDDDRNGYVDDVYGINAINGSGNPMDDNDHGTHVSGTIGGAANGGGPLVGAAWNVRVMALKFLDASGAGFDSGAIECIDYAIAKGAKVLSNSWGGGGYSQATYDAIDRARRANILFVAAAGNEGQDTDSTPTYPAGYNLPNVMSVGVIDNRGLKPTNWGNYGLTTVDLSAPGVDVYSSTADSDSSYAAFSGTSMATPHVSGVAALLAARFPSIGFTEIKQRIMSTATALPDMAGRSVTGGLLNANRALRATADGSLELSASVASLPLRPGGNVVVQIAVSDLTPVLDATVSAHFGDLAASTLLDNGAAPDLVAGDGSYAATLNVPNGTGAGTLSVQASAPGKTAASGHFTFALANPPTNDDFAHRLIIPAGNAQALGTNVDAGRENGEPRNPVVAGDSSVWWNWAAPTSGSATITTAGSAFDTTLAVYTGNSIGALSLVGANDDVSSTDFSSTVTFNPTAGVGYALQIAGYHSAAGAITVNFPAAGNAVGAPRITTDLQDTIARPGSTLALDIVVVGDSLAYQWFKDSAAIAGATGASLRKSNASSADAGVYRVQVANPHGLALSRAATVLIGERLANDNFSDAITLTGSGGVTANNQFATGEAGEPDHAAVSRPLGSLWYRWTATADGTLSLDTTGSDFDTTIAAYSGATVGALTLLAADDDVPGSRQARIEMAVQAGQTYQVAVDGFSNRVGNVTLLHTFTPASANVPNDDLANASEMSDDSATGTNIGARGETGEPNHAESSAPLASAWWRWTAPANGRFEFDTTGSDFDTTLAVYTGNQVDQLTLLGANDNFIGSASRVAFDAQAGQTYVVAVDGYANSQGQIALSLRQRYERPDVFARYGRTIGRGVYMPIPQVLQTSVRRGATRTVVYYVQNTGTTARQYAIGLSGTLTANRVVTTLLGGSRDLTQQARAGTLRTPVLGPGQYVAYSLRVNTSRAVMPRNYRYQAALRATDVESGGAQDATRVMVMVP